MKTTRKIAAYFIFMSCGLTFCQRACLGDVEAHQRPPQKAGVSESFDDLAARAQTAMQSDRVPEAINSFQRALQLRPDWSEGWWHLGTLLFDSGNFLGARAAFLHFVAQEQRQPGPGFGMLGLSEFHLKHYTSALAALERCIRLGLGNNADFSRAVLYHDGILNTLLGKPDIALMRLTLAVNQIAAAHHEAPKDAVLGDTELLDSLGVAALRMAKLPSNVPTDLVPLVRQAGRAQALIALQDRVAADEELKQLLSLYPSEPGVHYLYGVFLLKEHPPLAMDEFRREIQITPSHAPARIQLALEYLRTGDYRQGVKYAKEAIAIAPQDFVAHVAYGRLLIELEKAPAAIEQLRIAVKLAPGSPDAHFALSRAFTEAGRNADASRERAQFERLKDIAEASGRQPTNP
ncbi:MAG TPA: tetratricopeptide repeat protein [Terriglobales bacterium]|nr:tetratricopeptide repeat protein [Terriglobales bacterium]